MQCGQRADRKIIAFERGEYGDERNRFRKPGKKKLSGTMALILGVVLTLEFMIMGAMLFHIDFHSVDRITLILSFAAVYFGIVAGLTDK